jgi:ATP-dependent phosphofructokinase / diphosphate-dependent phosphofructokinase
MGRKAGHLALAIGKSSGATLSLIPEEFAERPVPVTKLADILAGAVIKRIAAGRPYGVAIMAEGLGEILDPKELQEVEAVARDEHGNMRLDELNLGEILKRETLKRLAPYRIKPTIVAKNIGNTPEISGPVPPGIYSKAAMRPWLPLSTAVLRPFLSVRFSIRKRVERESAWSISVRSPMRLRVII